SVFKKTGFEKTLNMKSSLDTHFRSAETMEMVDVAEHATFTSAGPPASPTQGKKIWIDIDNSPHVPFFLPIIEELEARGYEIILTARDMYQVVELLEMYGLPCKVVGGHWGKNKILKVLVNVKRTLELIPAAAKARPDLAVSHGSRAQVLACKTLGIPSV